MNRTLLAALGAALIALAVPTTAAADSNAPTAPQVALGASHTCALSDSGDVDCWGSGSKGQNGVPGGVDVATPTRVSGLTKVVKLVAYAEGTCALREDGVVLCWGSNDLGQLGTGTADSDVHSEPVAVTASSSKGSYDLVAGNAHVCSINWNEGVKCWGDNSSGQLVATGARSIKTITASAQATCLRTHDSKFPSCVGALAPLPEVPDTWQLVAGGAHGCLLSWQAAGVTCWGAGMPDLSSLTQVETLGSSAASSCAVAKTKLVQPAVASMGFESKTAALQCWGAGVGPAPVALTDVGVLSTSSSAPGHCAIVRGGTLHCWTDASPVPQQVAGLDLVNGPQYPAGKWVEITSKLRGKGKNWRVTSRLHVKPSPLVYPEDACRGSVSGEVFYWKKVRVPKQGKGVKKDRYEQRRVGVRTRAKLRRVGEFCKADFVHTVSKKRFAKKRGQLMARATFSGNAAVSAFESGDSELKKFKPKPVKPVKPKK